MAGFSGSTGVSKKYVDDAIAQSTAVVELAVSPSPSGVVSAIGGRLYQIGKIVLLDVDVTMTGSITSDWINALTVPKFPLAFTTVTVMPDKASAGAPLRVRIRPDNGAVQLFYGGSGNYHIHAVYPTA
jgi:hypothetical protein